MKNVTINLPAIVITEHTVNGDVKVPVWHYDSNAMLDVALGCCPCVPGVSEANLEMITQGKGLCPDLGWHDVLGLACSDWAAWGKEVDSFVDSW